MHELDSELRAALAEYARTWPQEAGVAAEFIALLDDPQNPFLRERLQGHFTGSAWLLSRDGRRVLLTHHRKLGRWLQLGGHADGDRDLAAVALREAEEESGIAGLLLDSPRIFDIDKHWIPERGQVPGHWHHDVRYVVRATDSEVFVVSEESLELAWRAVTEIAAEGDDSMRRMADKWLRVSAG